MIQPAVIDFAADRWVACIRSLTFVDYDFAGAAFASQVRLTPDASGAPLVDLATVTTSSAEGVRLIYAGTASASAHVLAGRLPAIPDGMDGSTLVLLSQVGIRINETTMEGLPFPIERGGDPVLAWDLHITPSGGVKDKFAGGKFTVRAGVTE